MSCDDGHRAWILVPQSIKGIWGCWMSSYGKQRMDESCWGTQTGDLISRTSATHVRVKMLATEGVSWTHVYVKTFATKEGKKRQLNGTYKLKLPYVPFSQRHSIVRGLAVVTRPVDRLVRNSWYYTDFTRGPSEVKTFLYGLHLISAKNMVLLRQRPFYFSFLATSS